MIGISLMRDTESKFQKIFAFLNVVPGVKKDDGTRTYDFKGGINYKLRLEKLNEIAMVLNALVRGQQRMIGQYSIVNDSSKSGYNNGNGGMKSLLFNYNSGEEGNSSYSSPVVMITSKFGDKKISVPVPPASALTFAEVCQIVFKKGIEIDMAEFTAPSYTERGNDFGGGRQSSGKQEGNSGGGSENFSSFSNEDVPF